MSEKTSTAFEGGSHADPVQAGSEKSFGDVFSIVFLIIGLFPLWYGNPVRSWSVGVALAFLITAFVAPRTLRPLNLLWHKFGMLLHHIVTPLVMGILFFGVVTPFGLLMRAAGNDPMRVKKQPDAKTYWIERAPPGPEPSTMKNQF